MMVEYGIHSMELKVYPVCIPPINNVKVKNPFNGIERTTLKHPLGWSLKWLRIHSMELKGRVH